MSQTTGTQEPGAGGGRELDDWEIPAILILVIVFVVVVIGILFAVNANSSDDTTPLGQTEAWTRCLRSEGVNVPLIEATNDGGFRITVDGSLIDDGLNSEALPAALSECADEAPERIREFIRWTERFSDIPFFGGKFFDA